MGKALYRQYRSSTFDEVIGQDHITKTLQRSLKSGSIAHAYLLTGPRGVGKTSVARILAFAVNDLAYEKDGTHLDIIEIDAASNRRIDEIRTLRERVNIAPTSAKYKVYIIDEVHMLTREAFNALLKTLEEPPEHVIFILATTDIHKLPDTIVSRCITFTFHPISQELLVKHLRHIAKAESINITDSALELLAMHGDGSFRDSISLLDQVKNLGSKMDSADIEIALGMAPEKLVDKILIEVKNHKPKELNEALEEAYKHGASELNLAKQLSSQLRTHLMAGKLMFSSEDTTALLKNLLDVPSAANPRSNLEINLLSQLYKGGDISEPKDMKVPQSVVADSAEIERSVNLPPSEPDEEIEVEATIVIEPKELPKSNEKKVNKSKSDSGAVEVDQELWDNVLQKLKAQNNTLYGVARMASADLQDNTLSLSFKFPFHFKQVNNPKTKSLIGLILKELGHKQISLDVRLLDSNSTATSTKKPDSNKPDKNLENITNIFGSGEMLES